MNSQSGGEPRRQVFKKRMGGSFGGVAGE
eukprot:COSAG04_NODE_26576_length_293_cov_0.798969_1_plen_28_part_10